MNNSRTFGQRDYNLCSIIFTTNGYIAQLVTYIWVLCITPGPLAPVGVPTVVLVLGQVAVAVGVGGLGVPPLTGDAGLGVTDSTHVVHASRRVGTLRRNCNEKKNEHLRILDTT